MCLYDPWKWMGISEVGTEGAVLRGHLQAGVLVGESGLETCRRRSLEGFPG